jgi:putative two-component system response regulator
MHDIGKFFIPQEILKKSRPLNDEEFKVVQEHTVKAHQLLKNSSRKIMKAADIIAYEHHEKWDGTGYPQGLRGEDINILGRIVAIADVFDTLCHKRAYSEAWSTQEAVDYILQQSAKQFDPTLVAIFEEHLDEFTAIV